MMKKFLFSFLAVLVSSIGFGGISTAEDIKNVALSATIPVSGDSVSVIEYGIDGDDPAYSIEFAKYELKDGDNWTEVTGDDVFLNNNTYRVLFRLIANDPEVPFYSGSFDDIYVNRIYGEFLQHVPDTNYSKIDVCYEFEIADPKVIDNVSITGFVFPKALDKFNQVYLSVLNLNLLSDEYHFIDFYFYFNDGSEWILIDDFDQTFTGGYHYKVDAVVDAYNGFVFSDELNGTINGDNFDAISNSGSYKVLSKEFSAFNIIDSVSVSNVVLPTVGKTIEELGNTPTSLTYGGDYIMESIEYYVRSGDEWSGEWEGAFQKGKKYNVVMNLVTTGDDIIFNSSLYDSNIAINGSAGKLDSFDSSRPFMISISKEVSFIETLQTPVAGGGGGSGIGGGSGGSSSSGPSTAANSTNANHEIKAVEQTDDMNLNPSINELIHNDFLKEELEKNKELYKDASMKVIVALLNLKQYDIFMLKETAEAYKKATPEVKQNVLAVLNGLANDNSKRAKYVTDYFKFIAGIE